MRTLITAIAVLLLTACGGGGDDTDYPDFVGPPLTSPPFEPEHTSVSRCCKPGPAHDPSSIAAAGPIPALEE